MLFTADFMHVKKASRSDICVYHAARARSRENTHTRAHQTVHLCPQHTRAVTNKHGLWGCKQQCLPKPGRPAGVETPTLAGAKKIRLQTDMLCSVFTLISLFPACVIIKKVLVPRSIFTAQKLCAAGQLVGTSEQLSLWTAVHGA